MRGKSSREVAAKTFPLYTRCLMNISNLNYGETCSHAWIQSHVNFISIVRFCQVHKPGENSTFCGTDWHAHLKHDEQQHSQHSVGWWWWWWWLKEFTIYRKVSCEITAIHPGADRRRLLCAFEEFAWL